MLTDEQRKAAVARLYGLTWSDAKEEALARVKAGDYEPHELEADLADLERREAAIGRALAHPIVVPPWRH